MKVLHVLYQSLPQISGSSIRSRDILMSQMAIGLDVIAITSPFQSGQKKEEVINGIRYLRTSVNQEDTISDKQKPFLKRMIRLFKIFPFYRKLGRVIEEEEPNVLHAHAMFFCGLPVVLLGKKYNLPVIYEVRSLWMLRKNTKRKSPWDIFLEDLLFRLELFVMNRVDKVIAINSNLKKELIEKGVCAEKIEVVNNAVNTILINNLKERHISKRKDVSVKYFGYIGTLTPHEGLDFLIEVFKDFSKEFPQAQLNIYGKGIEEKKIKVLAGSCSNINYFGPIKPEEIPDAFDNIDIIINPRYKNKLTDSVTPLKPLEAMAYDKLFVGSDVGGIKELVKNGENGFLFESGNHRSLLNTMKMIFLLEENQYAQIKKRAKQFVLNQKSWESNAKKYDEIYNHLMVVYAKCSGK